MKWLAFIVFVYLTGAMLGGIFEKTNTIDQSGTVTESNLVDYIFNIQNVVQQVPLLGGAITLPAPNSQWVNAVWKIASLQFSFMQGPGFDMVYRFLLLPFVILAVGSMIMLAYSLFTGNLTWS